MQVQGLAKGRGMLFGAKIITNVAIMPILMTNAGHGP